MNGNGSSAPTALEKMVEGYTGIQIEQIRKTPACEMGKLLPGQKRYAATRHYPRVLTHQEVLDALEDWQ